MDEVEQKTPAVQERGKVVLVTVSSCYLCSVDSALNPQGPLSQAVPCVHRVLDASGKRVSQ